MCSSDLSSFFEGAQSATSSWIPPGLLGFNPGLGIRANGQGKTGFPARQISVRFSGSDTWNLVFQNLQRRLAEKLGVKLRLEQLESREFQKLLAQMSGPGRLKAENMPSLMLLGWVADYPDPHNFMNLFTSASENNYLGWKNARYDELVEKALSAAEETGRKFFYQEAQKLLLEEEVVLMPLFCNSVLRTYDVLLRLAFEILFRDIQPPFLGSYRIAHLHLLAFVKK